LGQLLLSLDWLRPNKELGVMTVRRFWELAQVSNVDLVSGLQELVVAGSRTEARIVAHLAEVESRSLHLHASDSLFGYCQKVLGLSQNEAYYRIVAARLGRGYPLVFELLAQRRVHVTSLSLIRHYVTPENHGELLAAISGRTKEQILRLLATREPRPDAVNLIRKLPVGPRAVAAGPTASLEPLSADTYCLQLHTTEALKQKLELAADLMSHANPSRDLAVVVERALDLLIQDIQKKRFGQTKRPRATATSTKVPPAEEGKRPQRKRSRHVPNEVKRDIVARDTLACTHTLDDGTRCNARAFLEIQHDDAWAKGGGHTPENTRFLCAAHNRLLAEEEFGPRPLKTG
jgi:hypothetical protein